MGTPPLHVSTYDLKSLKLPVLTGSALSVFASAVQNRVLGPIILGKLLKDAGIMRLRQTVLTEAPTFVAPGTASEPVKDLLARVEIDRAAVAASPPTISGITDFARAYRQGVTSPSAVAEAVLSAITDSDQKAPPLRAMIAVDASDVRKQAALATERLRAGQSLGVLDGVPVVIKDELDMVPYPTTVGTTFLGRAKATADATLVSRLRQAGALLVGKANMHEIGINPNGHNKHYGMVRNPYGPGHDPGGSSSGPAAAVAAGLCPLAIGADGGGSIRIPAALCGVVGLKATHGRFSEHGVAPLCWSVGHVGPIGASVQDVVIGYGLSAGPDPLDPASCRQPNVEIAGWHDTDLSGVRLGVFSPWFEHASQDVSGQNRAGLELLVARGAKVCEVEIPGLDLMRIAHAVTILTEMNAAMAEHVAHFGELAPTVQLNLAVGRAFSSRDYVQAQRVRTRALATFAHVFEQCDVVITPATAIVAPAIREHAVSGGWSDLSTITELMRYVIPGNLLGLPAIAFPVGYDAAGLPIGMQAMAPHWQELLLLRVARAMEEQVQRRPPLWHYELLAK